MDEHGYYFTNLLNEGTNVGEFNTQSVEQISQSSPIMMHNIIVQFSFMIGNIIVQFSGP